MKCAESANCEVPYDIKKDAVYDIHTIHAVALSRKRSKRVR